MDTNNMKEEQTKEMTAVEAALEYADWRSNPEIQSCFSDYSRQAVEILFPHAVTLAKTPIVGILAGEVRRLRDVNAMLREELEGMSAITAGCAEMWWAPIESAPAGKVVLLFEPPDLVCMGVYNEMAGKWAKLVAAGLAAFKPTHWMPLPQKPESLKAEG